MTDYGSDVHTPGALDLDPWFTSVAGPEAVLEAAARGLVTATGSLVDDEEWGYDLRVHVNDHAPNARSIEAAVAAQLVRDERVRRATATVTFDESTGRLSVACLLLLAEGTFRLTLNVSAVTASFLTARVS